MEYDLFTFRHSFKKSFMDKSKYIRYEEKSVQKENSLLVFKTAPIRFTVTVLKVLKYNKIVQL